MRHSFFYDDAHANKYLVQSILRIGEEPVYIHEANKQIATYVFLCELQSGNIKRTALSNINLSLFKLGYVNMMNSVIYVTRQPTRFQKIGLCRYNVDVYWLSQHDDDDSDPIVNPYLVHCIKNIYPSINDIGSKRAIAFSRSFAVMNNGIVVYNGKTAVGIYNGEKIKLKQPFFYLNECINELGVPCGF